MALPSLGVDKTYLLTAGVLQISVGASPRRVAPPTNSCHLKSGLFLHFDSSPCPGLPSGIIPVGIPINASLRRVPPSCWWTCPNLSFNYCYHFWVHILRAQFYFSHTPNSSIINSSINSSSNFVLKCNQATFVIFYRNQLSLPYSKALKSISHIDKTR